MKNCKKIST